VSAPVAPGGRPTWHDEPVEEPVEEREWVGFHRTDAGAVIDMVRAVAAAGDPGMHGHGVEVVIEAPRLGWFARMLDDDGRPDQARIAVTTYGGDVSYPFNIHLVTDTGGRAAQRVPVRPGWARSNSAGMAFLIQKGRPGAPFAWAQLVAGAVAALTALRDGAPDEGWRARVDRAVRRQ
jgi:hypothetical protein